MLGVVFGHLVLWPVTLLMPAEPSSSAAASDAAFLRKPCMLIVSAARFASPIFDQVIAD
jgi:hypothetical protein